MHAADDMTLDEIRDTLAPAIAGNAAFDGWNAKALDATAAQHGIDAGIAALAFPGGPVDMIDAWFGAIDTAMVTRLPAERVAAMKIRERIAAMVLERFAVIGGNKEALRRALAVLALPGNAGRAARLGWRAADAMWRHAGDTATDYNHYTKRALLSAIYGATVLVWIDDDSDGEAETRAFLARRIDNVMQFEKAKAGFLARRERVPSLSRFIGRLRYPAI